MHFDRLQLSWALALFNGEKESKGDSEAPIKVVDVKDRKRVTMSIGDSDLRVEFEMVFQKAGEPEFWMAVGHRMNDYYMRQVGEECDPFEAYGRVTVIPCVQVFPHPSSTYKLIQA